MGVFPSQMRTRDFWITFLKPYVGCGDKRKIIRFGCGDETLKRNKENGNPHSPTNATHTKRICTANTALAAAHTATHICAVLTIVLCTVCTQHFTPRRTTHFTRMTGKYKKVIPSNLSTHDYHLWVKLTFSLKENTTPPTCESITIIKWHYTELVCKRYARRRYICLAPFTNLEKNIFHFVQCLCKLFQAR